MNPWLGGALAIAAFAAGYARYGWPGVLLAATAVAFWLLLQFSRALRVMRRAGQSPIGQVDSAVMLSAKLQPGFTMLQVLPLTNSLGVAVGAAAAETYCWSDAGSNTVRLQFENGRLKWWQLERPDENGGASR